MRLTDALLGEHAVFYALFDHVAAAIARARVIDEARASLAVLDSLLRSHARLEDELLFPVLEQAIGSHGPLAVMRLEHQEIDEALDDARAADDLVGLRDGVGRAIEVARPHFHKEELVLFPLARDHVGDEELERRGAQWAQRRGLMV